MCRIDRARVNAINTNRCVKNDALINTFTGRVIIFKCQTECQTKPNYPLTAGAFYIRFLHFSLA